MGLDFAFSWPRWYLDAEGLADAADAWARAAELAALPARDLPRPFWGAGIRPLADAGLEGRERFRLTETAPAAAAAGARSTFHAGGNGTVGLQSIRGMPHLAELRRAGVAVWPFEAPRPASPAAVEIFPRMIAWAPAGARARGAAFRAGRPWSTRSPGRGARRRARPRPGEPGRVRRRRLRDRAVVWRNRAGGAGGRVRSTRRLDLGSPAGIASHRSFR